MCNHVCFNYRGISWWGDPYSFVSDIPSGPNVQANVTFFFFYIMGHPGFIVASKCVAEILSDIRLSLVT